ncbi:MAG: endonuclease/exonuclease/phosphatase family protein [Rhodobacteraceae bacterium]|nr:endonuclease/exonuclease/phosphatase family protein [Paracoccaceae bacterium]
MLLLSLLAPVARAEAIRIATFNVDLSRDGPGVLLAELTTEPGQRALAAVRVIQAVRPDVLVIQKFDHDLRGRALAAFADLLRAGPEGIDYPHRFAAPVNAGLPSGFDLDDDTLLMGWDDALGWGKYPGHGGMAALSRLPLDEAAARTFRSLLWRDLPGAQLPIRADGAPFFTPETQAILPLSSRSHWDLPVILPDGGRLHLLTANPTPPLFDGPEGRNRLRNRDEALFWVQYLDGAAYADDQGRTMPAPDAPLVMIGDLNLDPFDGRGDTAALERLLAHPRLQDPAPASQGAVAAAAVQRGANARHRGPAAQDTADWRDDPGPGNLRVSYVLPSAELAVEASGVFWPAPDDPAAAALADGPPHHLVWVDIRLP